MEISKNLISQIKKEMHAENHTTLDVKKDAPLVASKLRLEFPRYIFKFKTDTADPNGGGQVYISKNVEYQQLRFW